MYSRIESAVFLIPPSPYPFPVLETARIRRIVLVCILSTAVVSLWIGTFRITKETKVRFSCLAAVLWVVCGVKTTQPALIRQAPQGMGDEKAPRISSVPDLGQAGEELF